MSVSKTAGWVIALADERATVALGEALGRACRDGAVLFLSGTLGAGKTTLTRGVLQAFGHNGPVKSPTYTLVEVYDLHGREVFHFDLYRLADPEELEYMGIRDYFSKQGLVLIEWPSRGAGVLPEPDLTVQMSVAGAGREATISCASSRGAKILEALEFGGC